MGIIITPESELGKELSRWEQHQTRVCGDNPPGNPYVFRPYPKAMYRAQKVNGKVVCYQAEPDPINFPDQNSYDRACRDVANLNQRSFCKVDDDEHERKAMNEGWRPTIQGALDAFEQREREVGELSARMNFDVKKMSDGAQAEHAQAGDATSQHVVDIAPNRKRGRPAKGIKPVTGAGVKED